MSKMQRTKGAAVEREIVSRHLELGIHAERVPDSGASKYKGSGHDVDIYVKGRDKAPIVSEVKARAGGAGFTLLERWLSDYDALFLRRNRKAPLVVLPWATWQRIIGR